MKRCIVLLIAILLAIPSQAALAELIVYSWEGTIEPLDPNIDPWKIGAGKPFSVSAIVDEDAADIDPEVDGAFFDLTDASLSIDGVQATEFNDGTIWFQELGGSDSVGIRTDEIEFNGVFDGLFTFVALPKSTFTFTDIVEVPPIFPPAMMLSRQGAETVRSSYRTFVDGGVIVTAAPIPEPSTFVLSLLAALVAGMTLRRGRIR